MTASPTRLVPEVSTRLGGNLADVDRQVAAGGTAVEAVAKVVGRTIEQLLGLDGDVPVLAAVVTVSDQALSGFCADGFERSHRQSAGGAIWIATTFTGEVYGATGGQMPI